MKLNIILNSKLLNVFLISLIAFIFSALAYGNDSTILFETKSFLIKLQNNCDEGELVCNDISYSGLRKSDGARINLKGTTLNRNCKTSTCDVYGYEFKNGKYIYKIYGRSPESLTVKKDNEIILYEEGVFSSDISKFDTFKISKEIKQSNNKIFLGNVLISQKDIITNINESCDFPTYESTQKEMDSCIISKVDKGYYSILNNLENGHKVYLGQKYGFQLYLQKMVNNKNETTLTLSAVKDKVTNELIVYSQKYWESGANTQYYYIDDNLENIWLLKVIEDEVSRRVDYWKKYHINNNKDVFDIYETVSCKYELFYPERKKTIATCINE